MNNKLKIIEVSDYILAISDEEIREGDLCYDMDGNPGHNGCKFIVKCLRTAKDSYWNKHTKKIIAYQPKDNSPELDLPLLPDMVFEDNVEKLAEKEFPLWDTSWCRTLGHRKSFIAGYKAATKRFSEDDLRNTVNSVIEFISHHEPEEFNEWFERKIQSLKQPKNPKWFIAETTGGGEYLAGEIGGNEIWAEYPIELKTTTINGKTYLVGTYLYK